jgi:hypothetical protein
MTALPRAGPRFRTGSGRRRVIEGPSAGSRTGRTLRAESRLTMLYSSYPEAFVPTYAGGVSWERGEYAARKNDPYCRILTFHSGSVPVVQAAVRG